MGLFGIIITRLQFISSLNESASRREFSSDFVSWAITKFDGFAIVSIIATCLITIFLLYLLLTNKNNKDGFVWGISPIFVIILVIILMVIIFLLVLGTALELLINYLI